MEKNKCLGQGQMLEAAQILRSLKCSQMQLSPQMANLVANLVTLARSSSLSFWEQLILYFSSKGQTGWLGRKKGTEEAVFQPWFTLSICNLIMPHAFYCAVNTGSCFFFFFFSLDDQTTNRVLQGRLKKTDMFTQSFGSGQGPMVKNNMHWQMQAQYYTRNRKLSYYILCTS